MREMEGSSLRLNIRLTILCLTTSNWTSLLPLRRSTKVFDLAKRANYFQGDVENKKRNLAFTGKKVLAYTDGSQKTSATYNYASVPEVQELTRIFQNLSSTLEYGRRLEYCHRHQKLALDQESKQMESTAQCGGLEDIAADRSDPAENYR